MKLSDLIFSDKVPGDVNERVERAKRVLTDNAPVWNECLEFWRGNQYVFRNKDNKLVKQGTRVGEDGKPNYRIRQVRNHIQPIVRHEVSYATQRVPGYQINPSTVDPDDVSAARVSTKVAYFGYDEWGVKKATEEAVTYAVVADEGFVWPYWDPNVGPFVDDGQGSTVGLGDIKLEVLGPQEVGWEPGVRFEDSRWYIVRRAVGMDQLRVMYPGKKFVADAMADPILNNARKSDPSLVLVTDYLERPSQEFPDGRRYCIANGKLIGDQNEPYPYENADGSIVDEPVLHKLTYIVDPDNDRDQGLVRHLIDANRTINDCTNKQLEWKNLALFPQMMAPMGSFPKRYRNTDQPGVIHFYNPAGGMKPDWRPTPQIPPELSALKSEALNDMQTIAAQTGVNPADLNSGKEMQVIIERDANARQSFLGRLAEFHSALMRHCLTLVSAKYTEPRLLKINGRFGWETIDSFVGADLRSQVDVTVLPDSIEPRTRQALEARVMGYADRGWVSPEKAMAAIEQGTMAALVDSYELDVARAYRVLQKIQAGPQVFLAEPLQQGPAGTQTPSWMPRPFDNLAVQRTIFEDFAKTVEFEQSDPPVQQAVLLYLEGLDWLDQQKRQQQAQEQAMQAQQLGMANAARPSQTGNPSMPSTQQPQQPATQSPLPGM